MSPKASPRVLVAVRLPAPLARRLKVEAARRSTTVQALVEQAVQVLLGGRGKDG